METVNTVKMVNNVEEGFDHFLFSIKVEKKICESLNFSLKRTN